MTDVLKVVSKESRPDWLTSGEAPFNLYDISDTITARKQQEAQRGIEVLRQIQASQKEQRASDLEQQRDIWMGKLAEFSTPDKTQEEIIDQGQRLSTGARDFESASKFMDARFKLEEQREQAERSKRSEARDVERLGFARATANRAANTYSAAQEAAPGKAADKRQKAQVAEAKRFADALKGSMQIAKETGDTGLAASHLDQTYVGDFDKDMLTLAQKGITRAVEEGKRKTWEGHIDTATSIAKQDPVQAYEFITGLPDYDQAPIEVTRQVEALKNAVPDLKDSSYAYPIRNGQVVRSESARVNTKDPKIRELIETNQLIVTNETVPKEKGGLLGGAKTSRIVPIEKLFPGMGSGPIELKRKTGTPN